MRSFLVFALVLLPAAASAGVSCWTITDPDQRALCRATTGGSRGNCAAISDYALRKQCEVRTGAPTSACNAITDQWERQKCKDAAKH
jgi:hypothetical protein